MVNSSAQSIFEEHSIAEIWNNLQPTKSYYPLSSLYPAAFVVILFTLIHYVLDKTLHSRAVKFAKSQVHVIKPLWIDDRNISLSYNQLINTSKRSLSNKIKKYELTPTHACQLRQYHVECIKYNKHISKFQEASFKVLVFGFVYCYGLCLIFVDAKWFWDQKWMWSQPLPQHIGHNHYFNLDIYYFLQIGYHLHRALYQFFEHKRRDFWAMFIHHWVTFFLLFGSKIIGYQQAGATVLLCNDNVDLLLPLSKLCNYTNHKSLQTIFEYLFVVLWIPLRICLYFYKVLWSIVIDGYTKTLQLYMVCWFCLLGLIIIYLLQFFWGYLIIKMLCTRCLKGKGIKDTRSDDENN